MSDFPPACPHDPVESIADDVFMVRGSMRMNALLRISRNMTVVRRDGELTLVNPIRLNAQGEEQLKALGTIKRILRLGPMHGIDDPYYVETFGAEFWCQPGGRAYPEPPIDRELSPGGELPFADATLFCFESTRQPESVLVLEQGNGLLLTCDAIQHYGDYRHHNLIARMIMPFIGFPKTTLVGPFWLKLMTPEGASLRGDFERLLSLRFDSLLSAHGSFLPTGAHRAVEQAIAKAFA